MDAEQRFIAGAPRPRNRSNTTAHPALTTARQNIANQTPKGEALHVPDPNDEPEAQYAAARAVLLTRDSQLAQNVAMIAVGAGVELEQCTMLPQPGSYANAVLLVGPDCVAEMPGTFLSQRVVLTGHSQYQDILWKAAAATPGARVAVLPQGSAWLGEYLGAMGLQSGAARVTLLAGACGGAGTSSLAALLAANHALEGKRTLLVDADQNSTGLWQILRVKEPEGIGWEDLQQSRGALAPGHLAEILPLAQGSAVLSWVREPNSFTPHEALLMEVLSAARRIYQHIIIDVGRAHGILPGLLTISDDYLLVTPVRTACGTSMGRLPAVAWSIVLTGKLRSGIDTRALAARHSMNLGGYLPYLRTIERSATEGRLMSVLARASIRRSITSIQQGTRSVAS